MKRKLLAVFAVCMVSVNALAQLAQISDDFVYKKANESYLAGDYADAISKFEHLYAKRTEFNEYIFIALGLSSAYVKVGKYKEAETVLLTTRSEALNAHYENHSGYRHLLTSLGDLYYGLNNYSKANEYIHEVKGLYEENLEFGSDYVSCLSMLASIQSHLGYNTLAKILIDVAVRQARLNLEAKDKGQLTRSDAIRVSNISDFDGYMKGQYAQTLSNASVIYDELGYKGDAVALLKEAIDVYSNIGKESPNIYNNLAGMYLAATKYQIAIEYYEKALSLAESPVLFDQISLDLALTRMFAKDKDVADVLLKNAEIMRSHQQYAFTFLSEAERQSYWENSGHNIPLQNYILQNHGSEKHRGAIYNNALYTKGLLLRTSNQIYDRIVKSGDQNMLALYRDLLQTKTDMAKASDDTLIRNLKYRCDSIDKALLDFIGQKEYVSTAEPTWKDVQAKLMDDDVAIEFYRVPNVHMTGNFATTKTDGALYCAATIRKGYKYPHIVQLFTNKQLEALIEDSPYTKPDLFDAVWTALTAELKGVTNIYFSADADLHKVALESLTNDKQQTANSLWNLYRLSSTRELIEVKSMEGRKNFALFGGLKYGAKMNDIAGALATTRSGVNDLPGTEVEVKTIKHALDEKGGITSQIYSGLNGTEEMLKSLSGKDIDVIHLATHGYFWTDEDVEFGDEGIAALLENKDNTTSALLRSGILLSGANNALRGDDIPSGLDDGIATAYELSQLDFRNVDLVVLSACQSALGELKGDGVYGLQRGLKLAGVNSLLMTLWPVDDDATQMLMIEFYKHLLAGVSKTQSLKMAQDYVKSQDKYRDPIYWAGFILLDATNRVPIRLR